MTKEELDNELALAEQAEEESRADALTQLEFSLEQLKDITQSIETAITFIKSRR